MFKLEVQGETLQQLAVELVKAINSMNGAVTSQTSDKVPAANPISPEAEAPAKEKVTAKKKSAKADTAPTPDADTTKVANDVVRKKNEAILALQKVTSAHPIEKAREVLKEFGAARISELKDSDLAGFITRCEEVVATADAKA